MCEQRYVEAVMALHDKQGGVVEAFQQLYADSYSVQENMVDSVLLVAACAAMDYRDGFTQGAVFQSLWDAVQ
ncbi:MAG: hypothetical protein BWK73_10435 [Thiothrix lacustris]|uniref:Uncharacterized protein n=1 Tax=Thiothrix lacustris TaxID=525917 RepID=A0A1Y1QUE3_9GAMM|nr:MAG: hypothetical protein BWK73_10435 [Thiothrix lacustris]